MADKPVAGGLAHMPVQAGLAVAGARSGILSRGRHAAAANESHPLYRQAAAAYAAGDFAGAASAFLLAAEAGHAESQYVLSTLYDEGKGVPQDAVEAARWERQAAVQGHAYAQANVSFRAYAAGDLAEAFAWCQRAAYSQLPWAQFHLGLMYRKGEGVERSSSAAAHWYRLAAAQDFSEAQRKLADLYYAGEGVARNRGEAALWYRRAAEAGDAEAQFQLGHLYSTGEGVEADYVQSRSWIRKAAQQGHPQAMLERKRREYRDP